MGFQHRFVISDTADPNFDQKRDTRTQKHTKQVIHSRRTDCSSPNSYAIANPKKMKYPTTRRILKTNQMMWEWALYQADKESWMEAMW
jgi:hypothetical protein